MPTVEYNTIRIGFDLEKSLAPRTVEADGADPLVWRGTNVRFEVGLLKDDQIIDDISNLASVTLEVFEKNAIGGTPKLQKVVSAGSLDNSLDQESWEDGSKQHANFDFTDVETNLDSPGSTYQTAWEDEFYLVVSGVTSGGSKITYGYALLKFREDGTGSGASAPLNDPNYYTMAQVDAMFLALTGGTLTGFLTAHADPTSALHVATKQYVDNASDLVSWKLSCRVASTANVNIASAPSSVDGVTLSNGDRVLLKNQSSGSENGIYVFNGASSAMTRAGDANTDALMQSGFKVSIEEGTVHVDTEWMLTTNENITVGSTSLVFTETTGLGQVTVPNGLSKTNSKTLAWHASTHATPAGVNVTTDGAAATPAIARSTDLNTGLFFPGADQVALTAGGTKRLEANTTGVDVTGNLTASGEATAATQKLTTDGAAATPALARSTDLNTGLFFPGADQVALAAGGTKRIEANTAGAAITGNLSVTSDLSVTGAGSFGGVLSLSNGSAAAPGLTFTSETDTGIFRSAEGVLGFAFSGAERLKLGESGNNIVAEFPTYNFVLNPSDTTAGRGCLGLWQTSFQAAASKVLAWGAAQSAPGGNLIDAIQAWVADRASTAGKGSLHLQTEDGTKILLGDRFGFNTHTPDYKYEVKLDTAGVAGFVNESIVGCITDHLNYSNTGAAGAFLNLGHARGSRTTPASSGTNDLLGQLRFYGYDGAAFVASASIAAYAEENFSASTEGTSLRLQHTEQGAGSMVEGLRLDQFRNALFHAATRPSALAKGIAFPNGTAPSADPSDGVALWSESGAQKYRTSGANEGAGQANFVHNRSQTVAANGSAYVVTGSYAKIDFGTQDPEVTLPTAGTYLLIAHVRFLNEAAHSWVKFYNSTDGADVGPEFASAQVVGPDEYGPVTLQWTVSVTASKTIDLRAKFTGTSSEVEAAHISYVRLH